MGDEQDLARAYLEGYTAAEQAFEVEIRVYCPKCREMLKTARGLRMFMLVPPRYCEHCETPLGMIVQRVTLNSSP
jgi:RNase P subunit RPR2